MDRGRHRTLSEFWPVYLREHSNPSGRALHFLGTAALGLCIIGAVALDPVRVLAGLVLAGLVTAVGHLVVEAKRPAWPALGGVIALLVVASPYLILPGILLALAFAWLGHRVFEGNQPTGLRYPVWSMLCDVRLFFHMATGRMWWGDPSRSLLAVDQNP